MRVGVGYAKNKNAYQCGYQVGKRALKSGALSEASFVLAFCTNNLDVAGYVKGLRAAFGRNTLITGGTVVGVIANQGLSYREHAAAAMALQFEAMTFRAAIVQNIDRNEERAGFELAKQLGVSPDDKMMFMIYNMVKKAATKSQPPELNSMLSLLRGMKSHNAFNIPIFGGGLIGGFALSQSRLFYNEKIGSKDVSGIVFNGDFEVYSAIMHGCTPLDGAYHKITRKRDEAILELDGRPADLLIDEIFQSTDWRQELPVKDLTIARNYGTKYEQFRESNYVNRFIPGPIIPGKGIAIPEQDWEVGSEIQFMIRDNEEMIESTRRNTEELLQRIEKDGKTPVLGLYIDCAGRTAYFSKSVQEEASIVRSIFNSIEIPLLGFYSGIEISTIGGKCVGQEWTGLLIVIARS